MVSLHGTLLFGIFLTICGFVTADELIYDRIELLNSTYYKDVYNISEFRVTKFNRTSFVIRAKVEFLIDVDDSFEVQVLFYHNRLNNNQYTKSMAQIAKDKFCAVLKKFHNIVFTNMNKDTTNFPTEAQDYCPLKKGVYWLNNFAFDNDKIPTVLNEGHWKMDILFYWKNKQVLGMRAYFKLIKKMFGFGR